MHLTRVFFLGGVNDGAEKEMCEGEVTATDGSLGESAAGMSYRGKGQGEGQGRRLCRGRQLWDR